MRMHLEFDPARSAARPAPSGVVVDELVYVDASAADPATGGLPEVVASVTDETRISFDRIASLLSLAQTSLADVVKVNCYLSDRSHLAEFRAAFDTTWPAGPLPVLQTQFSPLAGGVNVLLDVVAERPAA